MRTSARMFAIFAVFCVIVGSIYAGVTAEYVGIVGFLVLGGAFVFLSVICVKAGDPEVAKRLQAARGQHEQHEVHLPPPSVWPFVIAVGAAVTGWGMLMKPAITIAGVIVVIMGTVGWGGGFRPINRELAAWGLVWRHRQYQNLAEIAQELEKEGIPSEPGH